MMEQCSEILGTFYLRIGENIFPYEIRNVPKLRMRVCGSVKMLMGKSWHKFWTFYGTRIAQNRTMRVCGQNMVQILVKVWCKIWEKFGPRLRVLQKG